VPTTSIDTFRIVELSGHSGVTTGPAGKKLMEEIRKSSDHSKLLKQIQNLHPMLFEECYIKQFEHIRSKQASESRKNKLSEYDYRGVHLFVMVHGF